jgi:choline-sulfatase
MATVSRRELLAGAAAVQGGRTRRRPNFLFILADDHAGYALGCDGNPLAQTPNLDRLASEGTRFAQHYCNSPVCTPSRQSFFTGQLPHAAGVTRLRTQLDAGKPTLAKQFRTAGYRTAVFGKMHFNRAATPGLHGFETLLTEGELQREWSARVKPAKIASGIPTKPLPWRPFRDPSRIWLNADKLPYPCHEAHMKGTYLADQAIHYLEQNTAGPFALWVSFHEPHSPFDFPVEDRTRIDPSRLAVPRVGPNDAWQIPLIFRNLSEPDKQGINAAYYTSVAFLDRNIGRVLDALRRLRLEEDTLVVYIADHGYNLGHHGRFEKHCGYDPALRVPLIIRWPGRVGQRVVSGLTESIDVPATIIELLDLPPLPVQHGHNLLRRQRDHIFSEYLENEEAFIRTERWKYIFCSGRRRRGDGYETENPLPGRYQQLYDLKADPGEFTNVAPDHPRVVEQLRALMLQRFRDTHPEAGSEPRRISREEALEWYLRPRDDAPE